MVVRWHATACRTTRLGGAQIARDFGLRPDLVTFPAPSIAGQVSVPSSVAILINGTQLLSAQADPGPFEARQLPIVNGANDVALVVNTALGQQVTTTLPIYTSNALLAPGLDAYSVEVGAVRRWRWARSRSRRSRKPAVVLVGKLACWPTVPSSGSRRKLACRFRANGPKGSIPTSRRCTTTRCRAARYGPRQLVPPGGYVDAPAMLVVY